MKVLITIVIIALLVAYLFFSARSLWRSGKGLAGTVSAFAEGASASLSSAEPRPADEPIAPPYTRQRRARAWDDLRRVRGVRRELRSGRMNRARGRWQGITTATFPRMNRRAAKAYWAQRKADRS